MLIVSLVTPGVMDVVVVVPVFGLFVVVVAAPESKRLVVGRS